MLPYLATDQIPHRRRVHHSGLDDCWILESVPADGRESKTAAIRIGEVSGVMALRRYSPFWYRPEIARDIHGISADEMTFVDSGASKAARTGEIQFLLWGDQADRFGVLIPFARDDRRAFVRRVGEQFDVVTKHDLDARGRRSVGIMATGSDPFQLIATVAELIAAEVPGFRVRAHKRVPEFLDHFGWCTWDAFYQEVSREKIEQGLRELQRAGVSLGFLMIDDGWQKSRDWRFTAFASDELKFPGGLAEISRVAKRDYGVGLVGVWHTLQGYWRGVASDGAMGHNYEVREGKTPSGYFDDWPDQFQSDQRGYVGTADIYRWFHDFYTNLAEAGIEMVKVDNQNMLEFFTVRDGKPAATMAAFQQALQGAAGHWMGGNLINCMCNNNDVAFNLASSVVWRNSDDFFPEQPRAVHARHVFHNALNNLWSATFSIPDWDMFQSSHEHAEFHAMSRAISGGPIYVSDQPGTHDVELIAKLTLPGGRILRCPQPALPTRDSLFLDPMREDRLLKVFNRNSIGGMVGLFNCRADRPAIERISAPVRPSDIVGLRGDRFVVFAHRGGALGVVAPNGEVTIELAPMQGEIVTIAPIVRGVGVVGLVDKFNSIGGVQRCGWVDEQSYGIELLGGGRLCLFAATAPMSVQVDGVTLIGGPEDASGLFFIPVPVGGKPKVLLQWEAV